MGGITKFKTKTKNLISEATKKTKDPLFLVAPVFTGKATFEKQMEFPFQVWWTVPYLF